MSATSLPVGRNLLLFLVILGIFGCKSFCSICYRILHEVALLTGVASQCLRPGFVALRSRTYFGLVLATSALLPVIGATAAQFLVHGVLIFANASLWAADSALGHGALHHELDWFTAGHIDVLSLVSRRGLIRSRSLAGFRHRCFHGCEPAWVFLSWRSQDTTNRTVFQG